MKFEKIKELIKILVESNLQEISYKEGENKIELKKTPAAGSIPSQLPQVANTQTGIVQTAIDGANLNAKQVKEHEDKDSKDQDKKIEEDANIFYQESPLVGTFYQSPNPESEPFVKVGSKVKKGDPLCIVEAMKIMNVIESEVDGTIEEICIENAHFVEYKSRIFKIRKP